MTMQTTAVQPSSVTLPPDAAADDQRTLDARRHRAADISIVVPTFNERENVSELVRRLDTVLAGQAWEVVFVDDDSTDGTIDVLRALARQDARVRFVHRIGRRGLSSAVVEGIQTSSAPFAAVMDADLQHDETILPAMLTVLQAGEADMVVGSRYAAGGGVGEWDQSRMKISSFATKISRVVVKQTLTDPMSGFFMFKREAFDGSVRQLSTQGYKILLDLLASSKTPIRVKEEPYTFRTRIHGESKLDTAVVWEYLMLLLDKMVGHIVPIRFLMFMIVGGAGVFVHMAILTAIYELTPRLTSIDAQTAFTVGQTVAAVIAMTFNFFVNNFLTYRDKRLKGLGMLFGLISFYLVCSVGAVANVGIASALFGQDYSWWLSAIAGILVGAVWNYGASSVVTWRKK